MPNEMPVQEVVQEVHVRTPREEVIIESATKKVGTPRKQEEKIV
jgi:hypothetical protein